MIKGIDTSRAGMAWEQSRTELIGNNIANVNTEGFKRSVAVGSEFASALVLRLGDQIHAGAESPGLGFLGHGASLTEVVVDATQGSVQQTESDLDLAIIGPGEFTYLGPGGPGYTRNGSFRLDAEGWLVTPQGNALLVNGAPLRALGQSLQIRTDGAVLVDGVVTGQLDIRGADASTRLELRALENANVDLAQEMTDLITALRSFGVNQRALQMQDQTLGKAVTELGNI
jgi:flagellar basal-body rod protein FlgF